MWKFSQVFSSVGVQGQVEVHGSSVLRERAREKWREQGRRGEPRASGAYPIGGRRNGNLLPDNSRLLHDACQLTAQALARIAVQGGGDPRHGACAAASCIEDVLGVGSRRLVVGEQSAFVLQSQFVKL